MKNLQPQKILHFLKRHWIHILMSFVYFYLNCILLYRFWDAPIGFTIIIYTLSMAIALSPIGEWIFRKIKNVRDLYTYKEKEYLMPIFDEVFSEVEKEHPKVNQKIGIYIIDEMTINACAIGWRTIAVTQGAIDTLSREQLKGLIAHEFGHIIHGDTIINMIIYLGSGIFTILSLWLSVSMYWIRKLSEMFDRSKVISLFVNILMFIAGILMIFCTFILQTGLAINSRGHEFKADMFAHEIGFGSELISAFYILQKTALQGNDSIAKKLQATHPHIARRIGALEKAQGIEYTG